MHEGDESQLTGCDEELSGGEDLARALLELARAVDEFRWEMRRQVNNLASVQEQNAEWIRDALREVAGGLPPG